jgi:SAM-dependent methyltransferase
MSKDSERIEIKGCSRPECYLCGANGRLLYQNLQDQMFGVPGMWNLKCCPNPACGLVWLDPMPREDEIWKAYQNYYTHTEPQERNGLVYRAYSYAKNGYLAQRFGDHRTKSLWQRLAGALFYFYPPYRESLDLNVMEMRAQPGKRLLEIGCGGGDMLQSLKSLGWQVEGVDLDRKAVSVARSRGLRVRQGTLAAQGYPSDSFQAITMNHVIEHIHDPLSLLLECHRILAPGGRLVVITPNLASRLHRRFRNNWVGLDPPRHLLLFSIPSLQTMAQRAGFAIKSLTTKARWAPFAYVASRNIACRTSLDYSGLEYFAASYFFWVEWAEERLRSNSGEELVLHGTKAN